MQIYTTFAKYIFAQFFQCAKKKKKKCLLYFSQKSKLLSTIQVNS